MKRMLLAAAGLAFILTLAQPTGAQDLASSIVGTWKITGQMGKEVVSGKTDKNFGEQPVGHYIYTRGGNFVFFFVADNRKAPSGQMRNVSRCLRRSLVVAEPIRSKVANLSTVTTPPGTRRGLELSGQLRLI